MPSLLVVDDEPAIRDTLKWYFEEAGYRVNTAETGDEAVQRLRRAPPDALISDIVMAGMGGLEVLAEARALAPGTSVILITAYATVETAVEALRRGAADYIVKPFRLDDVRARVERVLAGPPRAASPQAPSAEPARNAELVGRSEVMQALRREIARVASRTSHVLVTGATGTGKELTARAIHAASPRRDGPFMPIHCGAIPEPLFESALFGHARGAFTGAVTANRGLIAAADRGTLFLDEIREIPLPLQVKLLRFIEDKEVWAVGRTEPVRVDCRIIASTNSDLRRAVADGTFREDLFYRLNVVHLTIPALRDRRDDVPLLVEHFRQRLNAELGTRVETVEPAALRVLVEHDWPGNVRELRHVVESAMVACDDRRVVTCDDLPRDIRRPLPPRSLKDAARAFERERVLDVLADVGFDKRQAARRLGVSLASLYRKLDGKKT